MLYLKYRDPNEHRMKHVAATPTNMFIFCSLCGEEVNLSKDEVIRNPAICFTPYLCLECRDALCNADDVDPFDCDDKEDLSDEHDEKCTDDGYELERNQEAACNQSTSSEGRAAEAEGFPGISLEAVLPDLIRILFQPDQPDADRNGKG